MRTDMGIYGDKDNLGERYKNNRNRENILYHDFSESSLKVHYALLPTLHVVS